MGYIRQGNNMIAWGRVTGDPRHREFDTGKQVTNFGVAYDRQQENGEWKNKTIYVDAWGTRLAPYAACLEKGDTVLVAGELKRDDYASQKKGTEVYKINAAFCECQPTAGFEEGEYDEDAAETLKRDRDGHGSGSMKNYETSFRGSYDDPGIVDLPGGDDELPDFLKD